ncbi:hypothetical protein CAEBREN_32594 [Caenorhabditis brenneri]|uniref:7TM GPCR serpentine receptor class x (Srx) domain-containing protein n=1 Tax=Caenorhabditis brenneri TaxID=135651 RepID=G0P9Q7_CAEBE|nr:hypothetical protein CAEBREN_32594 [Caenorhabditis brenneri]
MELNSTRYDFSDPFNLIASTIMVTNGIFGIICNVLVSYVFFAVPAEQTSFNLMCVFRSIGNAIILFWGFGATFIPILLKGSSPFSKIYETIVIISCNNLYVLVQFSGVMIAGNRFCAMFFPLTYAKVFNIKITSILLTVAFLFNQAEIGYCLVTIYRRSILVSDSNTRLTKKICYITFSALDCFTLFSSYYLAWVPNLNPNCHNQEDMPNPLNSTAILLGLLILMNIATFSKIYFFYKSTETEKETMKRKTRKNKVLFCQTVFQDGIMLIDMLFTFKLSGLSDERYWTFISGTLVWQSVHSIDGFVMVMFNERLTFLKRRLFGNLEESNRTNIQMMTSVHH